ncbi:MAG: hypothetical protein V5786_05415 [Psychromonas sp.]
MSNATDKVSPASRAMLVGAIIGGTASVASQWKGRQTGEIETNQLICNVTKDSLKAGLVSGSVTYVAGKMAGRPLLSMLTLLSAGAASLYMMEHYRENKEHE